MDLKSSKSKYKSKLLIFIATLFITFLISPPDEVYATSVDGNYAGWAASLVHSDGSSNQGGTDYIPNGVSYTRTGYLAYLLTVDGATTGHEAIAFKSPGFDYISDYSWYCTSRRGHRISGDVGFAGGVAPWGCTPWQSGGSPTNEPVIKEWFQGKDSNGVQHGVDFVDKTWGRDAALKYIDNEYILVVETLMHFQYSSKIDGGSNQSLEALADQIIDAAYGLEEPRTEAQWAAIRASAEKWCSAFIHLSEGVQQSMVQGLLYNLKIALVEELSKSIEGSGRQFTSPPLIGTPANLLNYKNSHEEVTSNPFKSYTNKVAPFSEYAIADGVAERAGFQVWTGSFSSEISDGDVQNYGVAMMIITASDNGQTTCDEPSQPSPHEPPDESEGTYTIVKNYRTLLEDGTTYQDDGVFSKGELGSNIIIENETEYQVVGWKITDTTNTGLSSIDWNPPGSVQGHNGSGTKPGSVKIEDLNTCLYVLLEKITEPEPEILDYNYKLTQSQITRRVWFSNPDYELDNMGGDYKITDHPFQWKALNHVQCNGHAFMNDCDERHTKSCSEAGCTAICSSGCTDTHHETTCAEGCTTVHGHKTSCGSTHTYNCGEDCVADSATCGSDGWQFTEDKLTLSINNTLQNTYPDVLATKEGWNAETQEGNIIKYFHTGGEVTRDVVDADEYFPEEGGETGWDYVCILMRGADKLTLAQWENEGSGNGTANTDLVDASSSGFTVANTDSGTRKTIDYYETFNATFGLETEEGVDNYTTAEAINEAEDEDGNLLGKCTTERGVVLMTPLSINSIKVKIEVYSGSADKGVNDTYCNPSEMLTYPVSGYNTSSGRMVPSGSTVSFTPYILMKYDTITDVNLPAYVLSEFTRQMTPNDYAELSWNKKSSDNLSLISAQWSTHADACKDWGADNVLPGGATLSLNIKKSNRQEIAVTTYQCIVEGSGKLHVENTGGSFGTLTRENAVAAHNAYVATVQAALEATNVQQYVEENPSKDNAFGGIMVYPEANISSLSNTQDGKASSENKYYFRDDGTESPSNEGDLDVNNQGTDTTTYTFYTCTKGDVHMKINNTSPKACADDGAYSNAGNMINLRTLVREKLEKAVERNQGSDAEAIQGTAPNWYSEAFDGITVIKQTTILEVGYNDPPERSSVLDPKLTPRQTSQRTLFSKYFLSQFKTKDYSSRYNEPLVMGEFKTKKVKLKDMDYLFYSRKFWIPNVTTQDLH